jgi:hypothetical protein
VKQYLVLLANVQRTELGDELKELEILFVIEPQECNSDSEEGAGQQREKVQPNLPVKYLYPNPGFLGAILSHRCYVLCGNVVRGVLATEDGDAERGGGMSTLSVGTSLGVWPD